MRCGRDTGADISASFQSLFSEGWEFQSLFCLDYGLGGTSRKDKSFNPYSVWT